MRLRGGGGGERDYQIDPRMLVRDEDGDYPTEEVLKERDQEKQYRKQFGTQYPNATFAAPGSRAAKMMGDRSELPEMYDSDGNSMEVEVVYQAPGKVHDPEAFFEKQRPWIVAQRVWEAAAAGDAEELQLMVAYLGGDPDAKDDDVFNFTACHWAAYNGHAPVVALLDSMGANLSPEDAEGSTPLHYASDRGFPDVVRLLLSRGADALAENDFGRTALHWAQDCIHWGYHGAPPDRTRVDALTPGKLECITVLREACGLPFPHDLQQLLRAPTDRKREAADAHPNAEAKRARGEGGDKLERRHARARGVAAGTAFAEERF